MSKIRIGIPTNDRMYQDTLNFFHNKNITIKRNNRSYTGTCPEIADLQPIFIRYDDIPQLVDKGDLHFGVTTNAIIQEKNCNVTTLMPLGFSKCRLVIAAQENIVSIADLKNKTIATSFKNITAELCRKNDIKCNILHVSGSCEAFPAIGAASAIVDITQTGNSLNQNNLFVLDTLLDIEAVLITHPHLLNTDRQARNFIEALNL